MRGWLLSCSLLGLSAPCAAQALPAVFDHNRIELVAHADDGTPLKLVTDSGGGFNAISQAVADRLGLAHEGTLDLGRTTLPLVDFPAFLARSGIPAPLPDPWLHGKLAVAGADMPFRADGFLGSRWFAGRAWRIDYGRHEMALLHDWKPAADDRATPLGFQTNDDGERVAHMPRVTIGVDGKPLDMLLDTGATFTVTDESAPLFHVAPGAQVGGGFIMKTVYDEWHARHPDWRVVAAGDRLGARTLPMIEVPRVEVAGFSVGPVWFAQRPDPAFTGMMSSMMDKPVAGAFGGSGLQYFHVVLDYPRSQAWFGVR
jgi:hypothetical protein